MYQVVGKAHYQVEYEGKIYAKIRYTLQVTELDRFSSVDGVICDTVCIKNTPINDRVNVGDTVQVSYNKYGKPDMLININS